MTIVRRHVDEVHTIFYSREYGTDSFRLADGVEHASQ